MPTFKRKGFRYLRATSMDYLSDYDHIAEVEAEYNDTSVEQPMFPSDTQARGDRITGERFEGNPRHFPANAHDYVNPNDTNQAQGKVPRKPIAGKKS